MNEYHIQRYQYSTSADKFFIEKANEIKFEYGRVNFYKNGKLKSSYASNMVSIIKIKYA